jgi:hypothetical protein
MGINWFSAFAWVIKRKSKIPSLLWIDFLISSPSSPQRVEEEQEVNILSRERTRKVRRIMKVA